MGGEDLAGLECGDGDGVLVGDGQDPGAAVDVADAEVVHVAGAAEGDFAPGVSTDQGESVDIDVAANDDLIGAPLTGLTVKTAPAHGTAAIVGSGADQRIRYTPDPGYVGTDTLEYTITTASGSATAGVEITVEPVAPVDTTDDSETGSEAPDVRSDAGDDDSGTGSEAPGVLPDTGGEDPVLLAAATAMIVAGGLLIGGARRSRKRIR